jgi:hypothetical protein
MEDKIFVMQKLADGRYFWKVKENDLKYNVQEGSNILALFKIIGTEFVKLWLHWTHSGKGRYN